jgi:tRNA G18 (ribose-2'-O)-methylase SpoU
MQFTTKTQLDDLCQQRPHQNVALQVEPLSLPTVESPSGSLSLLLADIVDPQNIGSIIRSAAFFGVNNVYLTKGCAGQSPTVSKASAGSLEWFTQRMAWCRRGAAFVQKAEESGYRVIATGMGESAGSIWEMSRDDRPILLVLGNEGSGVPRGILEKCKETIKIPEIPSVGPRMDSLNVGVATAVMVAHISRFKT